MVYLAAIRGAPRAPSSAQVTPPEWAGWPAPFSFPQRRQELQLRQAQRGHRQPWLRGDMAAAPAGAQGPLGREAGEAQLQAGCWGEHHPRSRVPMGGMQRCWHLPVEMADLLRAGGVAEPALLN